VTSAPLTDERCPSCGGIIALRCCEICGERRPSERIYTLREFAHETFEVVTNVERSFLNTLWTLVRRPGELTAAYMRGERVRYLRPLQLFLLVNVAFFFVAGWVGIHIFSTPLYSHTHSSAYSAFAAGRLAERLEATGATEDDYAITFNRRVVVLARSLVIIMVPFFAATVAVVTVQRRRPPTPEAVRHIVFSLQFFCMLMLLTMFLWLLYKGVAVAWNKVTGGDVGWQALDPLLGATAITGLLAYLIPALRRAYELSRVRAVVASLLLVVAFYYVLTAYRFILFMTITAQI
jgi:hypothetical protein